jgi:hypothetical protein
MRAEQLGAQRVRVGVRLDERPALDRIEDLTTPPDCVRLSVVTSKNSTDFFVWVFHHCARCLGI